MLSLLLHKNLHARARTKPYGHEQLKLHVLEISRDIFKIIIKIKLG